MAEKILCVDDELNILLSLQRQLRKQFHIESALGPEKALAAIEREGPYAVIVSDLQMPGMTGLELLAKVKELSPDSVRIMLTGQADLETAIAAVNQGSIFRFLTKPCSAEELAATLEAALEQHRLVTAERNLLENTLRASVKVLTDVLSPVHPAAFSRASRIHRYVRHMAAAMKLPDAWQFEVAALLSQVGCITLEPGALDRMYTGDELSDEEKRMFAAHPAAGGELLAHIPRLEAVACMIASQNLSFGQSPAVPARVPLARSCGDGCAPAARRYRFRPAHYPESFARRNTGTNAAARAGLRAGVPGSASRVCCAGRRHGSPRFEIRRAAARHDGRPGHPQQDGPAAARQGPGSDSFRARPAARLRGESGHRRTGPGAGGGGGADGFTPLGGSKS